MDAFLHKPASALQHQFLCGCRLGQTWNFAEPRRFDNSSDETRNDALVLVLGLSRLSHAEMAQALEMSLAEAWRAVRQVLEVTRVAM